MVRKFTKELQKNYEKRTMFTKSLQNHS